MSELRKRDPSTARELAAARSDMAGAIQRNIEWLIEHDLAAGKPVSVADASERMRSPHTVLMTYSEPEQVTWHDLGNLLEHDPEHGAACWQSIRAAARQELATGTRAAKATERTHSDPYKRAQFLAVLEALTQSLKPQGGAEVMIVQQMAVAYDQWLKWQIVATQRVDQESWAGDRDRRRILDGMSKRQREQDEYQNGWLPPRLSDADAIDQAVMIADRYQRQYLRLVRALQGMRRVIGTVVMTGGQLNVADRQVVNPAVMINGQQIEGE